jgi:hypothetical protein
MELPRRAAGDVLLASGEMSAIRERLRRLASRHDLTTVIACAFDHRTRGFCRSCTQIRGWCLPACGRSVRPWWIPDLRKTRIVLQQWNRHFDAGQMRLDGRIPDLFLVSSMHLHSAECDRLIQDANRIEPARRPLIVVGGPRVIYEPWQVFSSDPDNPWGADVAVTGEEYVLLHLLEAVLSVRASREPLRAAFLRARQMGVLDQVPGLVYGQSATPDGPCDELVDTGIQRLLGDLDELPSPVLGYQLLEPPSASATLGPHALPANRIRKHCIVSSLVLTAGCKFRCSYCPIPAYNQRQYRTKSGERVADEMEQIAKTYRIANFFGTDDNFFNDPKRTLDIAEALARRVTTRQRPYCKIRWATEATIHDTLRMQEHLPVIRQSGLTALWLGVEDITGTLGEEGTGRGQDAACLSRVARPRDLSRTDDDASRRPAAGDLERQPGTAQPVEGSAQGRSVVHPGPDAHPLARLPLVRRHLHRDWRSPKSTEPPSSRISSTGTTSWLPSILARGLNS